MRASALPQGEQHQILGISQPERLQVRRVKIDDFARSRIEWEAQLAVKVKLRIIFPVFREVCHQRLLLIHAESICSGLNPMD